MREADGRKRGPISGLMAGGLGRFLCVIGEEASRKTTPTGSTSQAPSSDRARLRAKPQGRPRVL